MQMSDEDIRIVASSLNLSPAQTNMLRRMRKDGSPFYGIDV